jgi:hypothetical protein
MTSGASRLKIVPQPVGRTMSEPAEALPGCGGLLNRSLDRRTDPMHASRRIRPSRQPRSIGNNEIRGLARAGYSRIRSRGAIALGALLAIGTIVVLFWDVRAPADITTDHVMTLAMLVVTIAAGHYWLPAVQQRRVLPAIGLAVLFIAGTFVCVTGSAGRGAEVAQRKAAAAGNINEARKEVVFSSMRATLTHAAAFVQRFIN